jgi:hypothetical protein
MPHTVQALPTAEAPSPKAHAGAKRWYPFTFHHAPTPFINEKQEMKKERTKNVCAHLAPNTLAYLLSKKHHSFPQPAIPGEENQTKAKVPPQNHTH